MSFCLQFFSSPYKRKSQSVGSSDIYICPAILCKCTQNSSVWSALVMLLPDRSKYTKKLSPWICQQRHDNQVLGEIKSFSKQYSLDTFREILRYVTSSIIHNH